MKYDPVVAVLMLLCFAIGWMLRHVADLFYKNAVRKVEYDAAKKRHDSFAAQVDADINDTRRSMGQWRTRR